jgi:hypothetical protein
MRRRQLIKQVGAATTVGVGGTGLAAATESGPTHLMWTFGVGHREVMPKSEFKRRSDTRHSRSSNPPTGTNVAVVTSKSVRRVSNACD